MKYDFNTFVNRDNTLSVKWNYTKESVGVEDALPMWVADMDFETVPEIKEAIIKRAEHAIYGYTATSNGFYQSIIDWFSKRHNWNIEKEWIVHSSGVINALHIIITALTEPGEGVLIQPPVYHPFYRVIKKCGRNTVLSPLKLENGKYVPNIKDIEEKIKNNNVKIFLLCNPHNPVGRVFSKEELTAIGELCLKYNVIVLSDEIHGDLVYKQYKHVPFASISKEFEQNSIICTAPSKTFNLAGLHTSNIIIPNKDFREKYENIGDKLGFKSLGLFGAIACEAGYKYGEEWLEQVIDYIEENKKYAAQYIESRIPKLKVYDSEGTYFLWIDCRELNYSEKELEEFILHKAKLWFNQGYIFGAEGGGFVRVNIACQRATLEEALRRLESAVKEELQENLQRV